MSEIERVWQFWLEPKPQSEEERKARGALWFGGGPETDRMIKEQFGGLVQRAHAGELDEWAHAARGRLALIILIDQFSRNVYRGSPQAFAQDAKALELARDGFECDLFVGFDSIEQLFAYLPFCHAEDLQWQRRSVWHAQKAALEASPELRPMMNGSVDFARKHLDVIARFGRFPHRNGVLGRETTPDEKQYLDYLKSAGQWL
jgi:uncharacterized protein (DUF924 family)